MTFWKRERGQGSILNEVNDAGSVMRLAESASRYIEFIHDTSADREETMPDIALDTGDIWMYRSCCEQSGQEELAP